LKWIGQHIWDFVSRFRNTIILQPKNQTNTDDYTQIDVEDSGGITFVTFDAAGTDANVRANIDGAFTLTTAAGTLNSTNINSEEVHIASSVSNKPLLKVTSTHTDTDKSAEIRLVKDAANVDDGENLGLISFYGDNDAGTPEVINYANVLAEAADMTDGQEAGKLTLNVAAYNGVLVRGILIDGDTNVDEQVNVTIGSGEGSVTTIAGPLNIASTLVMDESGLVAVANQSSITGVGTLTSGNATGIVTDATTSAKGKASFSSDNFAVSSGAVTIKAGGVDLTNEVTGVLPSANLDADTAHYSAQRQLTYYMFRADIDTTKTYVGLQEADGESSTSTNKNLPILSPVAGKLLKVFLRATSDLSGKTLTWTLETQAAGSNTGASPTVVGTQSGAGCTNQTMTTYDFTTGLDSGDNIIDAGDTIQLAVQSNASTANTTYYVTCLWEWDLS
tara:strand:+ start:2003 stop:3343 length:1341 start_codon:yes stop_codon:yes gene_type:complete